MWVLLIGSLPLLPAVPATLKALLAAPAIVNWSIAYLVIFPTAIGYVTWAVALKRLSAARATNFLYGVPPTATLIGFIWLGETPSIIGAIGGVAASLRRCDRQCNAAELTARVEVRRDPAIYVDRFNVSTLAFFLTTL